MVSAVILAAGCSTRMGRDKLTLKLGEKTLLQHVIENALTSKAGEVVVVLGNEAAKLRADIEPHARIHIVENPEYRQGMSASLKAGLKEVSSRAQAALVLLGDQPLAHARILNALIDKYEDTHAAIVAPSYRGKQGNPVIFDSALFSELMAVRGDIGGREVLAKHRDELKLVPIESQLAGKDVDTWQDYLSLLAAEDRRD